MEFFFKKKVDDAYREIARWIESYQAKLTGQNRFLCSYTRIKNRFPEYDDETLHKVWDRLRSQGKVTLDPLDGEWIVGKG